MFFFLEMIIALISIPFVIKPGDRNLLVCIFYIGLCVYLTPIGGILIYKWKTP